MPEFKYLCKARYDGFQLILCSEQHSVPKDFNWEMTYSRKLVGFKMLIGYGVKPNTPSGKEPFGVPSRRS